MENCSVWIFNSMYTFCYITTNSPLFPSDKLIDVSFFREYLGRQLEKETGQAIPAKA